MHNRYYIIFSTFLLLLGACTPAPEVEDAATAVSPTTAPLQEAPAALPTLLPTATVEVEVEPDEAGYPAPKQAPSRAEDASYPAPPTPLPPPEAYPGGFVWITHPSGLQCEEGTLPGYENLDNAVTSLTSAGINVAVADEIELFVATVCGGPVSKHYRAQIGNDHLQNAISIGWAEAIQ